MMSWCAVQKCDSINSYTCLHLPKATSNFILIHGHKDQAFSHNDFFSSWNTLSKAEFVRQTFPREARVVGILAGCIMKLILHLSRKTPSGSVIILVEVRLFGRSLLTDAQNEYLRGSLTPVLEKLKSKEKWSGKD